MEQVKTKSVEPQQRSSLAEVVWEELNEPLCCKHLTEMEHRELAPPHAGHRAYLCREPGCVICYDATNGYLLNKEGPRSPLERYTLPRMPCPTDAHPMYLVEVLREHPTFLVWRCPQCHRSRLSGKFWSHAA